MKSLATRQTCSLLRNIVQPAAKSRLLTRSITSVPISCRQSSEPTVWQRREAAEWTCKRQFSSTTLRAASGPRRDEDKDAAPEQPKQDERFFMPPPPESEQRVAAPPPPTSPREGDAETVRTDSTLVPESLNQPTSETSPIAEAPENPKQAPEDAEVQAAKHVAEENVKEEIQAAESLPSKHAAQRWQLSNNMQKRMDELLARAATVSHKVNNYTGTDYSGIERLRRQIIEQEQIVKTAHAEVAAAKEAYTTSYSQQAASQKEVVGLLERKHSWSAADLERYMSLIRSEHLNEQAVQAAKEHLASTERELEDARTRLEKKERKQYHEEQIWSDTIRRNSTWVTFGLMGLNIFLLLANLVIFEPWRRRRIIREIKMALDEATIAPSLASNTESAVDEAVEPAGQTLDKVEGEIAETAESMATDMTPEMAPEVLAEQSETVTEPVGETALAVGQVLPEEALDMGESITEVIEPVAEPAARPAPQNWEERLNLWKEVVVTKFGLFKTKLQDLFSERQVTLKKVDVTAIALEGAAAGIAVAGFLWVMVNPR